MRVDTVHQGDRDGIKGLYLINLVDEVTQFEFIGATQGISERFLLVQLEGLAHVTCDLNAAQQVQNERQTLFQYLHHHTCTHRVAS